MIRAVENDLIFFFRKINPYNSRWGGHREEKLFIMFYPNHTIHSTPIILFEFYKIKFLNHRLRKKIINAKLPDRFVRNDYG